MGDIPMNEAFGSGVPQEFSGPTLDQIQAFINQAVSQAQDLATLRHQEELAATMRNHADETARLRHEYQQIVNGLTARLDGMNVAPPHQPPPQPTLPPMPLPQQTVIRNMEPKASTPITVVPYDGTDRAKLEEFIASCEGVFLLAPNSYPTDQAKIVFVGHATRGSVNSWYRALYQSRISDPLVSSMTFIEFRQKLRAVWGDPHLQLTSGTKLRGLSQKGKSLADYNALFLDLLNQSGYTDTVMVNQLYFEGLVEGIRTSLTTGREPLPNTLEGMMTAAMGVDSLYQIRKLKRGNDSHSSSHHINNSKHKFQNKQTPGGNQQDRGVSFTPSDTDNSVDDPMDLGHIFDNNGKIKPEVIEHRRKMQLCFYCGNKGHQANKCPKKDLSANGQRKIIKDPNTVNPQKSDKHQPPHSLKSFPCLALPVIISQTPNKDNSWHSMEALLDSGSTNNLISSAAVKIWNLETSPADYVKQLRGADGRNFCTVTRECIVTLKIGNHVETLCLGVAETPGVPLVLGRPWLRYHNPTIDWSDDTIVLQSATCQNSCVPKGISNRITVLRSTLVDGKTDSFLVISESMGIPVQYRDYSDVFSKEKADILPEHRKFDCGIELIHDAKLPQMKRIYHLSHDESEELRLYVRDMEAKGFIQKSKSQFGAPVFFVPKKDGTKRLCVDYRDLNEITVRDRYPIPLTKQLMDTLSSSRIFTKIDLKSAYHLVRIKPGDEHKTAFRCRYGHYEYKVMPFGLTNAPAVFMRLIHQVLHDFLDVFVVVYLDDILVFSADEAEHVQHVRLVLQRLRDENLFAKLDKCEFHHGSVEFLGVTVTSKGFRMAPSKVKAVAEWPTPVNLKQVQSFIGFANFYRRFIKDFAKVAKPLTDLSQKETPFIWTDKEDLAFKSLRDLIMSEPVLVHPDYERPFIVETDASDFAIGAVLSQLQTDNRRPHPIAFVSRKLLTAERNYSVYDKELLAIIFALKEWRAYLLGAKMPIQILTDHANLTYFAQKQALTPRHARWAAYLAEFDFYLVHRPGKANAAADALSRRSDFILTGEEDSERKTQVVIQPEKFADMQFQIIQDDSFLLLSTTDIDWRETVIDEHRKLEILRERHDSKAAGHFGISKTYKAIAKEFQWPGMWKYVEDYVKGCETCQRNKVSRHLPYGLLVPLPIPTKPWASISLDFIVKLPRKRNLDSILVVVDRFTKNAFFIPCKESITAQETAELFFTNIFRQRGLPEEIVSDRGPQFKSAFWKSLFRILETKVKLSTAYHPQTDGQTERVNQTLEQYLRCFCSYEQRDWVDLLPFAEFAYNNATSESTGQTPFFALYGFHPKADFLTATPTEDQSENPQAMDIESRMKIIHSKIMEQLHRAQESAKLYANKKRMDHPFKERDLVWMYTKNLASDRPSLKLDYKKIGPFRIKEKINEVTFHLDLPPALHIHPIVHVSLLEPYTYSNIRGQVDTQPTILLDGVEPEHQLRNIIRSERRNNHVQYLVQWNSAQVFPSWESYDNMQAWKNEIEEFHRKNPKMPRAAEIVKDLEESDSSSDEGSEYSLSDDDEHAAQGVGHSGSTYKDKPITRQRKTEAKQSPKEGEAKPIDKEKAPVKGMMTRNRYRQQESSSKH
ncbi:hypothetical protein SmJEL517_g00640 [Synchytrium microbalum]|uniref:RNA-directed DNA polymerase n=1 Tax=Synchytrium microbalum TaxID=1806994 RepID=A0A507CCT1_9FUNG|nr:uncharacterized protein SmJEL517_g00640 [Synchytrium microbalum]TPX37422.1 hypothetical protein SmJEL517_g00640 [Synchytrium microbalum]